MSRPPTAPQPIAVTVGRNVRTMRQWRGWTLRELEARTQQLGHHIDLSTLSLIENGHGPRGQHRPVTVDQLAVLARALGIAEQDLLLPGYQPAVAPVRSASARRPQTTPVAGPGGG